LNEKGGGGGGIKKTPDMLRHLTKKSVTKHTTTMEESHQSFSSAHKDEISVWVYL